MAVYGEDLKTIIKQFETAHKLFWNGDHSKALVEFEKIAGSEGLDATFKDRVTSYISVCKDKVETDDFVPTSAAEFNLASVIALNNHEADQALGYISKAIEIEPENDAYIYLLACAQLEGGDAEKSLETIRKAIDLNETNKIYARNNPAFAEEIKVNEEFSDLLVEPVEETIMLED